MKFVKLIENAGKPQGFWGNLMLKTMNKEHSELTDWGLGYIEIEKKHKILDVGCGGGKTISKLCQKISNGKVYGIDYSQLCVEKSKKFNYKSVLCGKAKIRQASVSELPFEDDSMDIVTAIETYYFWKDKLNDLKEIKRVLRPNGQIAMIFEMLKSESNPAKWKEIEKMLNIEAVSEDEMKSILNQAGYENIKTYTKPEKCWLCVTARKPKEKV